MATTKTKSGRKSARKSTSKTAKSTTKTDSETQATSTKATAKARSGQEATEALGNTSKQQAALERGGSLAQRLDSEPRLAPGPDAPTEITSAAPPNVEALDEPGRASSPSFDEQPVTGKDATATPDAPRPGPRGQKIKAGEGEAPGQDKVKDIKALEDLPVGTTIEIRADAIVIHAAIAGGGRKTFMSAIPGKAGVKMALHQFNDFAENGPELVPGAAPGSDNPEQAEREQKQFDKEALQRSREDLKRRGITAD